MNLGDTIGTFQQVFSAEDSVGQAIKKLGKLFVGVEEEPDALDNISPQPLPSVVPLLETGRFGLDQAKKYGITKYMPDSISNRVMESKPVNEPEPEVVTAIAQAYAEDGRALPSNVSFVFYELGLENTVSPVKGTVTSNFGFRKNPITGKQEFHLAMDIAAKKGTEIAAFADGVVRYIGESDEFGLYFMIDHANGVSTFYAHCSKLLIKKGETVKCGQTVALVGSTGNTTGAHLHLTVLKDNIRLDPAYYVDPE